MHATAGKQKNQSTGSLDFRGAQTIMTYPTLHDVPFPLCRDGVAARTSLLGCPARAAEQGIRRAQKDRVKRISCFSRR